MKLPSFPTKGQLGNYIWKHAILRQSEIPQEKWAFHCLDNRTNRKVFSMHTWREHVVGSYNSSREQFAEIKAGLKLLIERSELPPENAWRLLLCLFLACFFVDSECGSIMNHQLEVLFVCLNVIAYIWWFNDVSIYDQGDSTIWVFPIIGLL